MKLDTISYEIDMILAELEMKKVSIRDITLLEWGILSALHSVPDASLDEISTELGLMRDFVDHVYEELSIIQVINSSTKKIEDRGIELLKREKMESKPIEISYQFYYSQLTNEWFFNQPNGFQSTQEIADPPKSLPSTGQLTELLRDNKILSNQEEVRSVPVVEEAEVGKKSIRIELSLRSFTPHIGIKLRSKSEWLGDSEYLQTQLENQKRDEIEDILLSKVQNIQDIDRFEQYDENQLQSIMEHSSTVHILDHFFDKVGRKSHDLILTHLMDKDHFNSDYIIDLDNGSLIFNNCTELAEAFGEEISIPDNFALNQTSFMITRSNKNFQKYTVKSISLNNGSMLPLVFEQTINLANEPLSNIVNYLSTKTNISSLFVNWIITGDHSEFKKLKAEIIDQENSLEIFKQLGESYNHLNLEKDELEAMNLVPQIIVNEFKYLRTFVSSDNLVEIYLDQSKDMKLNLNSIRELNENLIILYDYNITNQNERIKKLERKPVVDDFYATLVELNKEYLTDLDNEDIQSIFENIPRTGRQRLREILRPKINKLGSDTAINNDLLDLAEMINARNLVNEWIEISLEEFKAEWITSNNDFPNQVIASKDSNYWNIYIRSTIENILVQDPVGSLTVFDVQKHLDRIDNFEELLQLFPKVKEKIGSELISNTSVKSTENFDSLVYVIDRLDIRLSDEDKSQLKETLLSNRIISEEIENKLKSIGFEENEVEGLRKSLEKRSNLEFYVDGPNLARDQLSSDDDQPPEADTFRFRILLNQLRDNYGIEPDQVLIIISSALKHNCNNPDIIKELISSKLAIETPAKRSDDHFHLNMARERDGYVLSNDQYRDWIEKEENKRERKKMKSWLKKHRITFVWDETSQSFTFGENLKRALDV